MIETLTLLVAAAVGGATGTLVTLFVMLPHGKWVKWVAHDNGVVEPFIVTPGRSSMAYVGGLGVERGVDGVPTFGRR